MHKFLPLGALFFMTAAAAHAGSIDAIVSDDTERSIEHLTCAECGAVKKRKAEKPAIVLEPGTQKIELREVDGELKVFRTEAWLGGSPVTYVSKATAEVIGEENAKADKPFVPDAEPRQALIDKDATTSAVTAGMGGKPSETAVAPKAAFDPQDLQLRLN
jgi:hypothetical protein